MSAPSIAADDPSALFAFMSNALLVAGQGLDQAPWEGNTLGASFDRRYIYYRKPPWDTCGQLTGFLGRGFTGPQGVEQFITVPRTGGEYGFHTFDMTVEAITCVAIQQSKVPPSVEQMQADSQFVYAVGWTMFVSLTKAVAAGTLVSPTTGQRALVGPFEPGTAGGGFASISCGLSLQL